MTTTQRPRSSRPQRPPASAPNPASRGVILVVAAVVLGVILLVKGGGVGFDPSANELEIRTEDPAADPDAQVTTTTEAPPGTSVPPSELSLVALNGAGINGYAGQAQQFLSVAGYAQAEAATAASLTESTIVYHLPGFEADAAMLASLLELELAAVRPMPEDPGALSRDPAELPAGTEVVVLLGPDVRATIEGAAANAGGADDAGDTTTTVAG